MLIGYVRVSKSDGSQTLAPQRDAMLQADVEPERIYQDLASGRHDARRRAADVSLNERAPSWLISRPSQWSCVQSPTTCVKRPLPSQLTCVGNGPRLRVETFIIARRYI